MSTNLKKNIWTVVGVLIIVGSFILFFSSKTPRLRSGQVTVSIHQVVINGASIKVELAQTEAERGLGLSGHKPLADNEGMLFIFDKPMTYAFWMKDMLFPLDMVWIAPSPSPRTVLEEAPKDRPFSGRIVDITHNAKPESFPETFSPVTPAQYVLEVNADISQKNNWVIGDEVKFLP